MTAQQRQKTITHFSTYNKGGAGIAARRIFDGLRNQLVESAGKSNQNNLNLRFICRDDQDRPDGQTDHFQSYQPFFYSWLPRMLNHTRKAAKNFHRFLKNRPPQFEVVSPTAHYHPTALPKNFNTDLIHLHWVAFLFDYISFFKSIHNTTPIVWTLHDMNAFTGGCHYSGGCEKYLSGCGSCFQIDNPQPTDLSSLGILHKKKSYHRKNMTIVSPSQWLLNAAQRSGLFPDSTCFVLIPYGINTKAFYPLEKQSAKQQLAKSINSTLHGRITLLFGADNLTIPRKGIHQLKEALGHLQPKSEITCLIFGNGDVQELGLDELHPRIQVHHLGYLKNDVEKQLAYSAADLFVLPSLEDNQPQTGLEAMACQTPVVAFETGGMPDFVRHRKTGYLAAGHQPKELADAIAALIADGPTRAVMGATAREMVCKEFEIDTQTNRYVELYERLIGSFQNSSKAA